MKLRTTLILAVLAAAAWWAVQEMGDEPLPPDTRLPLVSDAMLQDLQSVEVKLFSDFVFKRLPHGLRAPPQ